MKTIVSVTKPARIVPSPEKTCTGRQLADVLRSGRLDAKEASAWRRNLRSARKISRLPRTNGNIDRAMGH